MTSARTATVPASTNRLPIVESEDPTGVLTPSCVPRSRPLEGSGGDINAFAKFVFKKLNVYVTKDSTLKTTPMTSNVWSEH